MDLKNFWITTRFTVQDELHNRSFYVLTGVAILFVLLLRGCFKSDMNVNGQTLNAATIGYYTSIVAFNIIAIAGILVAVLLSMRLLKRDRDDGMAAVILAKPVKRIEYMAGKIAGIWILSYSFTLILHLTVYIIMLMNTGGRIPFFIPASLVTSMNVLFAAVMVMLLSTILPDVIAALLTIGVGVVSIGTDSIAALSKNMGIQTSQMSSGHILNVVWPKIAALQFYATTLIRETPFTSIGPVHPAVNVLLYCVVISVLLFWKFSKEEV